MTLDEKIKAEMDIDNPKPLTEEEKQRLKHFNETDTEKEFWNLPYNTEQSTPSKFSGSKKPKTAREFEAYKAGYAGKQYQTTTNRETTFYLNGKIDRANRATEKNFWEDKES